MKSQMQLSDGQEVPSTVFLHIPKTAGTAFTNYLATQWPNDRIAEVFVGNYTSVKNQFDTNKIDLLCGHYQFRFMKAIMPNARFLTFLREPIARCISQYRSWNDIRNFGEDDPWRSTFTDEQKERVFFAQRIDINEFILCGVFDGELNDVQTVMLSDYDGDHPKFLESAIDNLRKIHFLGITEFFHSSIAKIRMQFPMFGPYSIARDNENRSRVDCNLELSTEAEYRLHALTKMDQLLYKFGCDFFHNQMK